MQASHDFKRVYVWEQPVRWFHWINALCVIVLGVTGYLIAHPPAFMSTGEASSGYWFGKLRFAHFVTAYVFLANFLFRLYWAGVGNKYTHWRNFFPISKTPAARGAGRAQGGRPPIERRTGAHAGA